MKGQFECDETLLSESDSGIRRMPPTLQVIHVNQPGAYRRNGNPGSIPGMLAFLANPAHEASYTTIVDRDGFTGRSNDDEFAPWAAGTIANARGLHVCPLGWIEQSREEWLSYSDQLDGIARILAWNNAMYGIPLRLLTVDQIRNGESGVCGHVHVARAWRETDHTDPGDGFPYDEVIARAININSGNPTESDWIHTMGKILGLDKKEYTPEEMIGFIDYHTNKTYNEHGKLLKSIDESLKTLVARLPKVG